MATTYDRATLKRDAKARLREGLPRAISVTLISTLFTLPFSAYMKFYSDTTDKLNEHVDALYSSAATMSPTAIIGATVLLFVGVAAFWLVCTTVSVGVCSWFLRYSRGEYAPVKDMFRFLSDIRRAFTAMLLSFVRVFLWSLLFVIPGAVKYYSYYLVPYILHDNPNISATEALQMSKTMMRGWKAKMFIFELSFIGWMLLSSVSCYIIGIAYALPYRYTAAARFYDVIRHHAVYEAHTIKAADLGLPYYPKKA